MPALNRITIYPIKALDGYQLERVEVLPGGALAGDRRFSLQDTSGQFINGKKFEAIHRIRARYTDDLESVTLRCEGSEETFALEAGNLLLAEWCGQMLGVSCRLVENLAGGFPDDCESPGPTLISIGSLVAVADWFAEIDLAEARRRFRMNLEIDSELSFWEDRLVAEQSSVRRFRIGDTVWQGRGICRRCVVPSRNALGGTSIGSFAREFSRRREETLPDWSPGDRFDHFYRLGVNTALESLGKDGILCVGDGVEAI